MGDAPAEVHDPEKYMEEEKRWKFCIHHYKGILIVLIPIIFAPVLLGHEYIIYRYIYSTIIIYLFFLLNVMPVGALAFMYVVLMPPFGVVESKTICTSYYSDVMFNFYGCLFIGIMMTQSKLDIRLAHILLGLIGTSIKILQIVVMLISALLTILLPTSFVTAIMMKVSIAIIDELDAQGAIKKNSEEEPYELFSKPYPSMPSLGIYFTVAFASTIGAMPSAVQSPNQEFLVHFKNYMPDNEVPGFVSCFVIMFPVMIFMLIILFLWIHIVFFGFLIPNSAIREQLKAAVEGSADFKAAVKTKKNDMGPWSIHSILAMILIVICAIILFVRKPGFMPGWADAIKKATNGDSVGTIFIGIVMFMVPANYMFCHYYKCETPKKEGTAPSLVGWKAVNTQIPWGHVFYLGSGFACVHSAIGSKFYILWAETLMRNADSASGLAFQAMLWSTLFSMLSPANPLAIKFLPFAFKLGQFKGVGGGTVALPAAMALHTQFMYPCSTPSNIIAAGWGNIRTLQFFWAGSVPTIFSFLFTYAFVACLGETGFPGYKNMQNITLEFIDPTTAKPK